ncbi:MAG: hypothetical protein P1P89_15055, partial [Desulfobacterales bacterium]|nr:hypothetical protein [Desulfobacterales bacterium]
PKTLLKEKRPFLYHFKIYTKDYTLPFFLLNLLAFFVHQILQLTDRLYQECRSGFSSRIEFWNQLRCTIRVLIFADFEHLLAFIIDPPESRPP